MQCKSAVSPSRVDSRLGVWAFLIGGALIFAGAGCSGNSSPASVARTEKPFAGVKLTLGCESAAVAKALVNQARGWGTRTGAVLESAPIATAMIAVVRPSEVGTYAEAGDAQPVPEALKSLEHPGQWARILPIYRNRLAGWAGEPRAIPIAGEGVVLVVNSELMTSASLREKYAAKYGRPAPAIPTTWEEIAELAEVCRGGAFTALATSRSRSVDDFLRVAACYDRKAMAETNLSRTGGSAPLSLAILSFTHSAETGQPRLTSPGFTDAARWYSAVSADRADDPLTALATDRALAAVLSLEELGRLPKDASGLVPARFIIAPLPGTRKTHDAEGKPIDCSTRPNSVPYLNGGWFAVVRKDCPNSAAAFDLLADLANNLELLSDPVLGFGPFRAEHLEQAREPLWQRYGFDAARTRQLADALRHNAAVATINPAFGLRGPDAGTLRTALAQALAAGNLAQAQSAWEEHARTYPGAQRIRRHAAGLQ